MQKYGFNYNFSRQVLSSICMIYILGTAHREENLKLCRRLKCKGSGLSQVLRMSWKGEKWTLQWSDTHVPLWGRDFKRQWVDLVLPQPQISLLSSPGEVPGLPQEISLAPYTGENPESRKMLFAPALMSLVSEKKSPCYLFFIILNKQTNKNIQHVLWMFCTILFPAKSSGFQVNSNTSPSLRRTLLPLQTLWSFPVYFYRLLHMPSQEKHFIANTPVHQHRLLNLHCPGTHVEQEQKDENKPKPSRFFLHCLWQIFQILSHTERSPKLFFPLLPSASWEQNWCDGLAKEPQSGPGNLLLPGFAILERRLGHCQFQARIILNTSSPAPAFVRLFPTPSPAEWHGKPFPQHTAEQKLSIRQSH